MISVKAAALQHRKKIALSAAALLLLAAIICMSVFYSYSRYESEDTASARNTIEEFYAAARLYLSANGEKTELTLSQDENGKKYFEVPVGSFDDLSMDIVYQGKARTYMRFRFDMNWYHIVNGREELVFHHYPDFTYDEELVFNNQQKDNYFYIIPMIDTGSDEETVYNVFTAMKDNGDLNDPIRSSDSADRLRIYITIDCVQFNRAKALWHITKFPWEG